MKRASYKPRYKLKILFGVGLMAIGLYSFHAMSTLLFSVLGLAPSSPIWYLVMLLGGLLAISGIGISLQTFRLPLRQHQISGVISGMASGAVLGFYTLGQLSGQQASWAFVGAAAGGSILGSLAFWTYGCQTVGTWRRFWGLAIAISSSACTYGFAFGLGAWMFAALSTTRWELALPLASATGLYLWLTQRVLVWIYRQWQKV